MPGQKYRCTTCDMEKVIRIKPSEAEQSINTGCEKCGFVTRHVRQ